MSITIPPELYHHIVSYLSPSSSLKDLLSLSVTCKLLHAVAIPVMYSTVACNTNEDSFSLFLRTLFTPSRYLRYAEYIHTYTLIANGHSKRDMLDMTIRALKMMMNLKNLALITHNLTVYELESDTSSQSSHMLNLRMLLGASFHLRTLNFSSSSSSSYDDLIEFLRSQPTITSLHIQGDPSWGTTLVPSDICPLLESLEGSEPVLKSFIMDQPTYDESIHNDDIHSPYRPRTRIRSISLIWDTASSLSLQLLDTLRAREINQLKLEGHFSRPLLSRFSPYLPNLRTLELSGLRSSDLYYTKLFPKLQHLILSRPHGFFSLSFPLEGHPQIAAKLFASNSMLAWVDMSRFDYNLYDRYLRDGTSEEIRGEGIDWGMSLQ